MTQIFLITRSKAILAPLGNKDIKNICGHPDKSTLSKVIFNWKFSLVTWTPKDEEGEEAICSNPMIPSSHF